MPAPCFAVFSAWNPIQSSIPAGSEIGKGIEGTNFSHMALMQRGESVIEGAGASFQVLDQTATDRGPLAAEVMDGNNNYVWDDGSEYFGEWQEGLAHGRGVFSWPNGCPLLPSLSCGHPR